MGEIRVEDALIGTQYSINGELSNWKPVASIHRTLGCYVLYVL